MTANLIPLEAISVPTRVVTVATNHCNALGGKYFYASVQVTVVQYLVCTATRVSYSYIQRGGKI